MSKETAHAIAAVILTNFHEWEAVAEQQCQIDQSDEPYEWYMMAQLVDAILAAHATKLLPKGRS